MSPNKIPPIKALNKAFLKVKPNRDDFEQFKHNLIRLIDHINEAESEEFHKNLVAQFLRETYYGANHFINTKGRNDLVIHNGKDAKNSVGVILEAKKPTNKGEMLKVDNLNSKAFQELVLYFLRDRISGKNLEIKYLVATNVYEWFIFDAGTFEKSFAQNQQLVKLFTDFEAGRLTGKKTDFFYQEIAAPAIEAIKDEITFTHFDLRDYEQSLRNTEKPDDNQLIPLFKLLSPEHLLKLPFANDNNSLDKAFYSELLHIIGLTETKAGGKKLIGRKKEGRNIGAMIENAMEQLDSLDKISRLEKPEQFGDTYQDRLFNVGLELAITWVNRILFLKLLEAQLIKYHNGDKSLAFLNLSKVQNYDDLNSLFFSVLARQPQERSSSIQNIFAKVPYLNSSLFELTELEHLTISISNLRDENLPILSSSVLKDSNGKKRTGELNGLEYFFEFLNAYDFSSEGSSEIKEDNKRLINASVLGLIFEKINGYKDGAFFTPGFITMYMCRETIRRAVVQNFNEIKGWNCQNINDLYDNIKDKKEANQIINSLKICDAAVGSGHFLVSALNETIAIKSELKILIYQQGKTLRDYHVEVANDELVVTDDDGLLFEYNPKSPESQRIQETLFHEKQTIIENCLFGVDINPNSVKICRLRLWIELLKNAYYKAESHYTELETLPNIDINIKCGNSLISRFALDVDLRQALRKSKCDIDSYKNAVQTYRNAESKEQKREMEGIISSIKGNFRTTLYGNDSKKTKLRNLEGERYNLENQMLLFQESTTEKKAREKKITKLSNEIDKLEFEIEEIESGKIYENAFEWRFEFPELLNNDGDFVGFDVVIGNPPWGANIDPNQLKHIKAMNSDIVVRMVDSFMFFINLTFSLKSKFGLVCQIIPDVILYQIDNEKLREKIFNKSQLEIALNLGDAIFEDVSRPACIILLTSNISNISFIGEYSVGGSDKLSNILLTEINTSFFEDIPNKAIPTKNLSGYKIINKYKHTRLIELVDNDEIQRGISPDFKEAFIVDDQIIHRCLLEKDFIFSTITGGRDLKKYLVQDVGKKIIYTQKSDACQLIPNILNYLQTFKEQITCQEVEEGKHPFWSLHRPRNKKIFLKQEKIIGVITGDRIILGLDVNQIFPTDGLYVMASNGKYSNKLLVGVLNSKLLTYFYRLLSMEVNRTLAQIKPTILKNLPVQFDNEKIVIRIESIVDQILTAKKSDPKADTTELEKEIDRLVYQLYELTAEEIKIVEGETA
ncbi:MAG: class I SAM-dependent DNA methyltransferase [Oscillatoriales cyanobacterium]|uniref:site-specific DNA-methyltransferase (adenine-specific) n=1 Tax=Microcoleus anatoxicus PTRS2 TaxID=2705321 RepID=A0ABU8YPI0_9CYAN|nr:MAG: class I SAM-dependent DNA methyltransferase [Oscillatoriales cyanobacterium]